MRDIFVSRSLLISLEEINLSVSDRNIQDRKQPNPKTGVNYHDNICFSVQEVRRLWRNRN